MHSYAILFLKQGANIKLYCAINNLEMISKAISQFIERQLSVSLNGASQIVHLSFTPIDIYDIIIAFLRYKKEVGDKQMNATSCRRPLNTTILAESFVYAVFGNIASVGHIVSQVVDAEANLRNVENLPTSTHEDFREEGYRTTQEREKLHTLILNELIGECRLENDDDIVLGKGGAKPRVVKRDSCAYIVSGAPASGKSGVAMELADRNGAYILDSDYAKRKFPEYHSNPAGASLVHDESDKLIFGDKDSMWEYCIYERVNIVIPLVGKTCASVDRICQKLIEAKYKIHIVNVTLDRYECTRRVYNRYLQTKRYVPLAYVFDEVGNEPERVYFNYKRNHSRDKSFISFTQLSNDVPKGSNPKVLEATKNSPYK